MDLRVGVQQSVAIAHGRNQASKTRNDIAFGKLGKGTSEYNQKLPFVNQLNSTLKDYREAAKTTQNGLRKAVRSKQWKNLKDRILDPQVVHFDDYKVKQREIAKLKESIGFLKAVKKTNSLPKGNWLFYCKTEDLSDYIEHLKSQMAGLKTTTVDSVLHPETVAGSLGKSVSENVAAAVETNGVKVKGNIFKKFVNLIKRK